MTPPFPGMDPFLEGEYFNSFHGHLLNEIKRVLTRPLMPDYTIAFATDCFLENEEEKTIQKIQIRSIKNEKLITEIHILTLEIKSNPSRNIYLNKIKNLQTNNIHILEIDLLRQGQRTLDNPVVNEAHYNVKLLRAKYKEPQVWAFTMKDPLPVVPVPLVFPHSDAVLDLRKAIEKVYEMGRYQYLLKYEETPPVPEFSEDDGKWLQKRLNKHLKKGRNSNSL